MMWQHVVRTGRAWREVARNERGQALAEFALVLPFLLLIIAGIITFGRGWNVQQVVTDAAREGARMAVIADPTVDSAAVRARINQRLAAAHVDTTTATVTITPGANWKSTGQPITISVSVPYDMKFVGALVGWATGSSTITVASSTTMRNE